MSIRHVVMWKLASEEPEEKRRQADEIRIVFEGVASMIPTLRRIQVRANTLNVGENWDVILEATYDDVDGLEAYMTHPAHTAAQAIIKKYAIDRIAIDYEF